MTLEYLPIIMLRALVITMVIEATIAWLIGIREKNNLLVVVCVNLITNPLVVSLSAAIRFFVDISLFYPLTLCLEIAAVYIEGVLYRRYLKTNFNPFWISVILNVASYLLGEIINRFVF